MPRVELNHGLFALVDEHDLHTVQDLKWHATKRRPCGLQYVGSSSLRSSGGGYIYMHRHILNCDASTVVDHINGNGLDNRRSNLRVASSSGNNRNRRVSRLITKTSRFKGVHRCGKRWRAQVADRTVGLFANEHDAAIAYDVAASMEFGEFALTNEMLGLLPINEWRRMS